MMTTRPVWLLILCAVCATTTACTLGIGCSLDQVLMQSQSGSGNLTVSVPVGNFSAPNAAGFLALTQSLALNGAGSGVSIVNLESVTEFSGRLTLRHITLSCREKVVIGLSGALVATNVTLETVLEFKSTSSSTLRLCRVLFPPGPPFEGSPLIWLPDDPAVTRGVVSVESSVLHTHSTSATLVLAWGSFVFKNSTVLNFMTTAAAPGSSLFESHSRDGSGTMEVTDSTFTGLTFNLLFKVATVLTLQGCTFSRNRGARVVESSSGAPLLRVRGCAFTRNTMSSCVAAKQSGTLSVNSSVFSHNTGGDNGGVLQLISRAAQGVVRGSQFGSNRCAVAGRGCRGGALGGGRNWHLWDSHFLGNSATEGGVGYSQDGSFTATRCAFHSNYGVDTGASVAAQSIGGVFSAQSVTAVDSNFTGNRADRVQVILSSRISITGGLIADNGPSFLPAPNDAAKSLLHCLHCSLVDSVVRVGAGNVAFGDFGVSSTGSMTVRNTRIDGAVAAQTRPWRDTNCQTSGSRLCSSADTGGNPVWCAALSPATYTCLSFDPASFLTSCASAASPPPCAVATSCVETGVRLGYFCLPHNQPLLSAISSPSCRTRPAAVPYTAVSNTLTGCGLSSLQLTLTGRNLVTAGGGAAAVTITVGGTRCTAIALLSSQPASGGGGSVDSLRCTLPARYGAALPVHLTPAPGLPSTATAAASVTNYVPALLSMSPPAVTAVTPAVGSPLGGTALTITGAMFGSLPAAITVSLGPSLPCGGVTRVNPTTITCTTPPGFDANRAVTVTVAGIRSAVNPRAAFSYRAPALTRMINPPPTGGVLSLIGSHFGPASTASQLTVFTTLSDGTSSRVACTNLTYISPTQVNCTYRQPVAADSCVKRRLWLQAGRQRSSNYLWLCYGAASINTVCAPGSQLSADGFGCVACRLGRFSPTVSGKCRPCPNGATCTQISPTTNLTTGVAFPSAKPGYWRAAGLPPDYNQEPFQRCSLADNCLGGLNSSCAKGYRAGSVLCGSCAVGYVRAKGSCKACPGLTAAKARGTQAMGLLLALLASSGVITVLLSQAAAAVPETEEGEDAQGGGDMVPTTAKAGKRRSSGGGAGDVELVVIENQPRDGPLPAAPSTSSTTASAAAVGAADDESGGEADSAESDGIQEGDQTEEKESGEQQEQEDEIGGEEDAEGNNGEGEKKECGKKECDEKESEETADERSLLAKASEKVQAHAKAKATARAQAVVDTAKAEVMAALDTQSVGSVGVIPVPSSDQQLTSDGGSRGGSVSFLPPLDVRAAMGAQAQSALSSGKDAVITRLKLLLAYLQILGSFDTTFSFPWPEEFRSMMAAASLASADLSLALGGLQCALLADFYSQLVAHMLLLPAALATVAACTKLVLRQQAHPSLPPSSCSPLPPSARRLARHRRHRASAVQSRSNSLQVLVVTTLYPGICAKLFRLFQCAPAGGGRWYLQADLTQQCFSGAWVGYLVLACLGILVYALGIPVAVIWLLRRHRASLASAATQAQYGALYISYAPSFWYWEGVEMVRKLILTGGLLLLSSRGVTKTFLGLLICALYATALSQWQPLATADNNRLALLAGAQLFLTLTLGLLVQISAQLLLLDPQAISAFDQLAFNALLLLSNGVVAALGVAATLVGNPGHREKMNAALHKCRGLCCCASRRRNGGMSPRHYHYNKPGSHPEEAGGGGL